MSEQQALTPVGAGALTEGELGKLAALRRRYPKARVSLGPGGRITARWPGWPMAAHPGTVDELDVLLWHYRRT